MNGAAMRELSCSKKRYMAISPWDWPRLDHEWVSIVPDFCETADIAFAGKPAPTGGWR
jgi:hypothetical protein